MPKKFTRTIEDFTCEHCGEKVVGNGYTNHCPNCLWSKHVDVNPGDRAATCGGLMEPVCITQKKDLYVLTHRCTTCAYEKNNASAATDNAEALIALAQGTISE